MQNGVAKLAPCILVADFARLGEQVIDAEVLYRRVVNLR